MSEQSFIVLLQGDTGTGKSTLALTFPKKIVHFELDLGGFRRAKRRFKEEIKSGQIVSQQYELPQQVIEDQLGLTQSSRLIGVKELWYKLLTDYSTALKDDSVQTIVIDSFAFLWDLCHMGFLQEKQEKDKSRERLLEIEYGEPNIRLRTFIYQAKQRKKNLILTAPLTDVRIDQMIRGEVKSVVVGTKAAGWRHVGKEVDFTIETSTETKHTDGGIVTVPKGKIIKSAVGLELVGMELETPTWDTIQGIINMFEEE